MGPIDIVIGGKPLKVHELTLGESFVVARMQKAAIAAPVEDFDYQVMRVQFYPVMFCCTKGVDCTVPNEKEFFELTAKDASLWYETAYSINPDAFPKPVNEAVPSSEEVAESEKEKKG